MNSKTKFKIHSVLMYLWQLPQNIVGLLVIWFTKAKPNKAAMHVYQTKYRMGVSLGNYIILGPCSTTDVMHEQGHMLQSRKLGILYLLVIGLPSITFNIYDRLFHCKWSANKRIKWYYSLPWEAWADRLGGVRR